jgi:hypothetical protein
MRGLISDRGGENQAAILSENLREIARSSGVSA